MGTDLHIARNLALLIWLLATITIGLQSWVGDQTIYSRSLEQKREELHFGILTNEAPGGGSWGAVGALSIQKRVGVVYLAEGLRKLTGLTVGSKIKLRFNNVFNKTPLLAASVIISGFIPAPS